MWFAAIVPDAHFSNPGLQKCLDAIHKDIVTIWNIEDPDEVRSRIYIRRLFGFIVP